MSWPASAQESIHLQRNPPIDNAVIIVNDGGIQEFLRARDCGDAAKFFFRFMLIRRACTIAKFKEMLAKIPFKRTWIETNPVGLEAWFES